MDENDQLFEHYDAGRAAEQQLAAIPEDHPDPNVHVHRAALSLLAHGGRQAEQQILNQPGLVESHGPRYQAVYDAAQEEHDQHLAQALASGELQIASPEDQQRLTANSSARSKIASSPYLTPEQKQDALKQTFADDAAIRRRATPAPPEARANSPDKKVADFKATLPPREQSWPWQYDAETGKCELPRGWTPLEPSGNAPPEGLSINTPPQAQQPQQAQQSPPQQQAPQTPEQQQGDAFKQAWKAWKTDRTPPMISNGKGGWMLDDKMHRALLAEDAEDDRRKRADRQEQTAAAKDARADSKAKIDAEKEDRAKTKSETEVSPEKVLAHNATQNTNRWTYIDKHMAEWMKENPDKSGSDWTASGKQADREKWETGRDAARQEAEAEAKRRFPDYKPPAPKTSELAPPADTSRPGHGLPEGATLLPDGTALLSDGRIIRRKTQ